ncbi:MAG: SPASM domain-containing protein [Pseudomonadota bacterium]|nr:SPASM domain-containing protein [Pseudomonadota bacterium]
MKKNNGVKCSTYGGKCGWFLRKYFSRYTSYWYLKLQYVLRVSLFKKYINLFEQKANNGEFLNPCLVSVETINRCNSTCSFCPASKYQDKRPFCRMSEELFKKIIKELQEMNYHGWLNLYVNNEPFMDTRIEDWYKYAKENLPEAKMLLYTNGTLLTPKRFEKIIPYIDKMIINNYSESLTLHKNIEDLSVLINNTPQYRQKDISIQIRYIKEILTNRAGEAPNKKYKDKNNEICIMPFTDFTVYPDGTVGLCCCDAREKTNLGNLNKSTIKEIWESKRYQSIRSLLKKGRTGYAFCAGCDFIDAGIRNSFMKSALIKRKD